MLESSRDENSLQRVLSPRPPISPPRIPSEFHNLQEVVSYNKVAVDELVSHLFTLIDKSENEALYWSTLFEESQKELFQMRENMQKSQKEEADYIDPEVIPNGPRRNSKQPIEEGPAQTTPTGPGRWGLFRGVLSAVVGQQHPHETTQHV